jgi:hypothetical protein
LSSICWAKYSWKTRNSCRCWEVMGWDRVSIDLNVIHESDSQDEKQFEPRIWTVEGIIIDWNDEYENADDSIRVNCEFDLNVIHESEKQDEKHCDPRISILPAISILDERRTFRISSWWRTSMRTGTSLEFVDKLTRLCDRWWCKPHPGPEVRWMRLPHRQLDSTIHSVHWGRFRPLIPYTSSQLISVFQVWHTQRHYIYR